MKKAIFFTFCLLSAAGMQVSAQTWLDKMGDRVKKKTVEKVEQRIEDKADAATDKALDKSEEAVRKAGKMNGQKQTSPQNGKSGNADATSPNSQKADVSYAKYDFVPGNEVIFEDDLKGERKGEFPSKWDLLEGNAEIAQVDGGNTLAMVGFTYITPLFKDKSSGLPDEFTLEFDFLIDEGKEDENAIELLNASDEVIANSIFWKDNTRFVFNWNNNTAEQSSADTYVNSPR